MPAFDVIVIGSGFGGAVTACRLAERDMNVLVLERGRRWNTYPYGPRKLDDAWFWSQHSPERANGWLDFRLFKHMGVAQCAGVLRITIPGFLKQLSTMRVTNTPSGPEKLGAYLTFANFFAGQLWDTYMKR